MLGEETPSLKDAGTEIAESAVLQGAGQAAGLGARKALPFMARRLYQAHAKPSVRLRQEFPTLVEDAVENRVPIGDKGVVRAEKLVGESSDKADAMVAGASGTVGRGDILQHVPAEAVGDAVDMLQGGGLGARMANMQGTLQRIGSGQPLTVQETQAVKRFLQGQGEQYYKAAAADASLQSGAKSELAAKMAQGAREGVERHVPAVGPQNAQTQRLIGVRRMAEAGTERVKNNLPTGLGMQTLISTGIGGAVGAGSGDSTKGTMAGMLALALTNPALATRLAIGINRVAPAAAHTPQAARAAYLIQALTEGGE
jgi:hypothetical protein